jgi:hypothetical protein
MVAFLLVRQFIENREHDRAIRPASHACALMMLVIEVVLSLWPIGQWQRHRN